ncbi:hypothetical protein D5H75_22610 [Bailinhaonella thermotolerans]|uniref:Uncharacterized protein n=1 Tax=Bailinhaonella thermotolerans TaxID=1070861 RepID=A0A3A4BGD8_9ACTN|nr:hypothetical protein D5H75_22610 [Bailinhaonella thermotolerans]
MRALEEILGLPEESLVMLLGPRRPRGRWLKRVPGALTYREVCPVHASLGDLLQKIENPVDGQLATLSHHEYYTVGPFREERGAHSRMVVRALSDGVDRFVAIHHNPHGMLPDGWRVEYARAGRVRTDERAGLIALEVLFDRPLTSGETYVLEYSFWYERPGPAAVEYHRGFRFPAREYLLQVRFDPAAVPPRCYRTFRPDIGAAVEDVRELRPDNWHSVHLMELDARPGVHGVRWEWH